MMSYITYWSFKSLWKCDDKSKEICSVLIKYKLSFYRPCPEPDRAWMPEDREHPSVYS